MTGPTRRRFLIQSAVAAAAATGGCVATSPGSSVDLVWGRRGLGPGRFVKPRAIAIGDDDELYIVDTTGRIQVFDPDGNRLRVWSTPATANGRPTGMAFQSAASAKDGQAKLLVADTHYYRMLVYTTDGQLCADQTIGGQPGSAPGQFAFLTDAVSDAEGCFYVGEYNASDRIQKFDPDGQFVCQWGGTGDQPGQFLRPQSLIVDGDVLLVADAHNHRIQRFDLRETPPRLIDVWGEPGDQPGQMYYPYGLARIGDGDVLAVEYKNNRVQRFSPAGESVQLWGSPGFEPGQLNLPWGLVVDSRDRVHVLDSNNHRVQRVVL